MSTGSSKENEIASSIQTQEVATNGLSVMQSGHAFVADAIDDTRLAPSTSVAQFSAKASWMKWYGAFKNILPIYIAVHLAFFVTTYFSFLFIFTGASWRPIYALWQAWDRMDTGHYVTIATRGYPEVWRTAFFPLYPLLMRFLMVLTHNPFTAGLIISNLAGLIMLIVLYRLVMEDFDHEQAYRTVLYLSVFPTAFFFAAAYNEALFLCLCLLSFYHMRHGHWWLAGLFGFLASLTRSMGIFLLVPFCYEYLRQHQFNLKTIRFDIVSGMAIPAGIGTFALYCYLRFHDALAFSHAQAKWLRSLEVPWYGMMSSINSIIQSKGILSFTGMRNVFELGLDLFILTLLILSFVGPWRLPRNLWAYNLYAALSFLFLQFFPIMTIFPLGSMPRFMLELFPAFIVLARIGKNQTFNMIYLMISSSMLFLFLVDFLIRMWVT